MDDRRGSTVKTAGGIGLGGLIVVGLITLLLGGNPGDVLQNATEILGSQTEITSKDGSVHGLCTGDYLVI